MKKLLILTLVLASASTAIADLDGWSLWVADGCSPGVAPSFYDGDYEPVDSEITLAPNDYLWIGIHNATAEGYDPWPWPERVLFLVFMDSPSGEWTGNDTQYIRPSFENEYYGVYEGMDFWYVDSLYAQGDPAGDVYLGVTDAMEFHYLGAEDVEVILFDEDFTTVIDTFTIHQVPEPATVLLLGLGGLAIIHRKRRT
jgi:hypothetical protein